VGFGARRQRRDVFYILRYRINGRQRMLSIGRHGSPFTPDTARLEAKRLLGIVASGVDPAAAAAPKAEAETFDALISSYLASRKASLRPRSYAETARHLLTQAKALHGLGLAEIDRRAIAKVLAECETGSGPIARNRLRSSLSAMYAWLIREGLCEINPVIGTGKAAESQRDRVLSDAELSAIWQACRDDDYGRIVRLLVLTGQRREEIGWLQWTEIDFARGLIVLPPERTKNHRLHEVPLSPAARAILEHQPRRKNTDGLRPYVFGLGQGGFSGWSDCKAALDARTGVPAWTLHDLRRTCATGMANLGVLPHVIEAVLNHVSGHKAGVAGIYNKATYSAEMREALAFWAQHVVNLPSP
jgi:integrase